MGRYGVKIHLVGSAEAIRKASPQILDRLAEAAGVSPEDFGKAESVAFQHVASQQIHEEAIERYAQTLKRMLQEISDVLAEEVSKSQDTEIPEELGEILWKAQIPGSPKAGHKYLRRVPYTDARGRRRYRYFYTESAHARQATAGEDVILGKRRLKIHEVSERGDIHFSENGKERKVSRSDWHDMMTEFHGAQYLQWAEKRARSTLASVYRHVPAGLLDALEGSQQERLEALRLRVPEVYRRLRQSFQRTGLSPFEAQRILSDTLGRRGWAQDGRAALIGSVLSPQGAFVAKHYREISGAAQNLARGKPVGAAHVGAAVELRRPRSKGDNLAAEIAKLSRSAEKELGKLEALLKAARENPSPETSAAVLAEVMAAQAVAKLSLLQAAYPGLKDQTAEDAREALLQVPAASHREGPIQEGSETTVYLAGEGGRPVAMAARYRVVEASELVPSHNPRSFRPNPAYPEDVQERAYHRDTGEQDKVRRNAQRLNPDFLINTNPDAVNGPPLITSDGVVLGGNSRTMSMQLAYSAHPDKAEAYKKALVERAHTVGLKSGDVEKMKQPVLVRAVEPGNRSKEELRLLVRQMNESFTQAMDPRTAQVAMGRKLKDKTLEALADHMEADETLDAFLRSKKADAFISELYKAGVIDERNANQYTRKGTRKLNEDGVAYVSRILVGRMVEDADTLSELTHTMTESLARATPYMIQAEGAGAGYSIRADMRMALSALTDIRQLVDSGALRRMPDAKTSDDELSRTYLENLRGLTGIKEDHPVLANERAQSLLKVLVRQGGKNQLANVFREYARIAERNPEGQAQLLGESMTPQRALELAISGAKTAAEKKEEPESTGSLF